VVAHSQEHGSIAPGLDGDPPVGLGRLGAENGVNHYQLRPPLFGVQDVARHAGIVQAAERMASGQDHDAALGHRVVHGRNVVVREAAEGMQVGHDLGRITVRQAGGNKTPHGVDKAPLGIGGGVGEHGVGELMGLAPRPEFPQLLFHYIQGFIPGDPLEFALPPLSNPLHRVLEPFRRVQGGDAGHPLDAHLAPGRGVALDLLDHPILNQSEDGAFGLALVTDRRDPFALMHLPLLC